MSELKLFVSCFSCWSFVGKTGSKQLLSLARHCWHHGIVVHEIGEFVSESIVTRGTASFKGVNKGAAIYVESTTTVHNLLFYVRTLWLNNLTVTFLLVSCSCKIQNLLLFEHRQG